MRELPRPPQAEAGTRRRGSMSRGPIGPGSHVITVTVSAACVRGAPSARIRYRGLRHRRPRHGPLGPGLRRRLPGGLHLGRSVRRPQAVRGPGGVHRVRGLRVRLPQRGDHAAGEAKGRVGGLRVGGCDLVLGPGRGARRGRRAGPGGLTMDAVITRRPPPPRAPRADLSAPNATITEREDVSPGVARLRIRPDDGVPAFEPGQYLALGLDLDGRPLQRPYSTASARGETDALEFLVRLVPDGALTPRADAVE